MALAPHCSMGPGIEPWMTRSILWNLDEDLRCRQKAMWLLFLTLSVCMFKTELSKKKKLSFPLLKHIIWQAERWGREEGICEWPSRLRNEVFWKYKGITVAWVIHWLLAATSWRKDCLAEEAEWGKLATPQLSYSAVEVTAPEQSRPSCCCLVVRIGPRTSINCPWVDHTLSMHQFRSWRPCLPFATKN